MEDLRDNPYEKKHRTKKRISEGVAVMTLLTSAVMSMVFMWYAWVAVSGIIEILTLLVTPTWVFASVIVFNRFFTTKVSGGQEEQEAELRQRVFNLERKIDDTLMALREARNLQRQRQRQ